MKNIQLGVAQIVENKMIFEAPKQKGHLLKPFLFFLKMELFLVFLE